MGIIDITEKPVIKRSAEASGIIVLSTDTLNKIRSGMIKKGDPLLVGEISGINAAKQTHLLIPHCHQIALDAVTVTFEVSETHIEARCLVKAQARTGVEMEALVGVSIALNTVWDMVKYLEKDGEGQYPSTAIKDIKVRWKKKEN
ncbi:MAG: cyclic pyranopterin monophosphate synthase MoaC [Deltaproteobacteria bacterium]|nr:cyclic pyranopterin monophosphate synthase MoaC [Deltaproteobacteria bacterium]